MMIKKVPYVKIAIILLLLSSSVQTSVAAFYTRELYSGYINDNETFATTTNASFTANFKGSDMITLSLPKGQITIKNGTCQVSFSYEACLEGIYEPNRAMIKLKAIIANITLATSMPSEVLISREYTVVTNLRNTGEEAAEKIAYLTSIPLELDAYSPTVCSINQNKVQWIGRLNPNEKIQCTYTIRATKNTTALLNESLTYFDGTTTTQVIYPHLIAIDPRSLQISMHLTNLTPNVENEIALNTSLKALKNLTITYLTIGIPEGFDLSRIDSKLKKVGNTLIYKGELEENKTLAFENRLIAKKSGASAFKISARFYTDSIPQELIETLIVNVTYKEAYIRVNKNNLTKNHDKISLFIVNPSNHTIYDVRLFVKGFINDNKSEEKIEGLSHTEYSYELELPDGEYALETTLNYQNSFHEMFKNNQKSLLTVNTSLPEIIKKEPGKLPPQPEKRLEIDFWKGLRQAKTVLFFFSATLLITIFIAFALGRIKKKKIKHTPPKDKNQEGSHQ